LSLFTFAPTLISYPLSLHDALPIFGPSYFVDRYSFSGVAGQEVVVQVASVEILPEIALLRPSDGAVLAYGYSGTGLARLPGSGAERKTTRRNSSHEAIGYGAVDQTT